MTDPTDAKVAELEREWPHWQVWCVRRVVGPITWHARRWDETDGRKVLNAGTPEELAGQLEEAEAPPLPAPTVEEMREIFFPEDPDGTA
jgi:hypothetical protein